MGGAAQDVPNGSKQQRERRQAVHGPTQLQQPKQRSHDALGPQANPTNERRQSTTDKLFAAFLAKAQPSRHVNPTPEAQDRKPVPKNRTTPAKHASQDPQPQHAEPENLPALKHVNAPKSPEPGYNRQEGIDIPVSSTDVLRVKHAPEAEVNTTQPLDPTSSGSTIPQVIKAPKAESGQAGAANVVETSPRNYSVPGRSSQWSRCHVAILTLLMIVLVLLLRLPRAPRAPPNFSMTSTLISAHTQLHQADAQLPDIEEVASLRAEIRKADQCLTTSVLVINKFVTLICTSMAPALYAAADPRNQFQYWRVAWAHRQFSQAILEMQDFTLGTCVSSYHAAEPLLSRLLIDSIRNRARLTRDINLAVGNFFHTGSEDLKVKYERQNMVVDSLTRAGILFQLSARAVGNEHRRFTKMIADIGATQSHINAFKSDLTWNRRRDNRTAEHSRSLAGKRMTESFADAMVAALPDLNEWNSFAAAVRKYW
jgi:hypothetical protein